jgi:hypothetical protein
MAKLGTVTPTATTRIRHEDSGLRGPNLHMIRAAEAFTAGEV